MLAKFRQLHSEVDLAYDLVQQCAHLLRTRTGKHLDAVKNGLTWWINNGMVEGHVTKLKLMKRQGRAGFPLLRKRVLHTL
ncbi:MAG: hypothetical protein ACRDHZ_07485 [Ktedonobacteraceae bacterium]